MFGGNFAPRGWAFCSGQLLSIAQNTALFSILGTTYGGNGQTTFALPDLRSRVPMHPGQGPGLTPRSLGEMGGTETVTLLNSQMPAHTHQATVAPKASTSETTDTLPTNQYPAAGGVYSPTANAQMGSSDVTVGVSGGNQPHNNMSPFTCVNFIIALEGIFPSRN